jgi:hypothetical protein
MVPSPRAFTPVELLVMHGRVWRPFGASKRVTRFPLPRLVVLILAFLWAHITASTLTATGSDISVFTARGTVVTEVFQQAGVTNATSRIEEAVLFSYSNGWWQVEVQFKTGFKPGIPAALLNGTVVNCLSIPDGIRYVTTKSRSYTPPPPRNAWSTAFVEPIAFPPPERNNLFICWLTLCPNPALPIHDTKKMTRLVSSEQVRDPMSLGAYTLNYDMDNRFVSLLCITNDGTIYIGGGKTRKLHPPFDKGHLEFEFAVLAATNWNGIVFPLSSVLRKHVPDPGGAKDSQLLFAAAVTRLNIESLDSSVVKPDVTLSQTVIYDSRLPGGSASPVIYKATNDSWIAATNNLALMRRAKEQRSAANSMRDSRNYKSGTKRMVLVVMMGGLLCAPMIWVIVCKAKYKEQTTNK